VGLLLLVAFVLLGRGRVASAACRQVRRLARVCGGVLGGVVGEARRWTDGVGFGGRARGWACERRLWGGGRWFLVMGGPLKVACSEAIIALEDAAAYLSARFKLFRFDGGGGRVGACCGVGEDRAAGGFVSRRG